MSVIISTYNRLAYLERALRTVLEQTFEDFEVLVCDDASTDDVEGLVAELNDPRIRYLRSKANLGMAANNRRGYLAARGEFLAHLDDDDEWTPRFLEAMVDALSANPDCSLAFSNHSVIDEDGRVDPSLTEHGERVWGRAGLRSGVHRPFMELAVISRSIPTSHTSVIRSSAIDHSRIALEAGLAWDLWLTYLAAREGWGAYFTTERLTRYRIHGTQSSFGTNALRTYEAMVFCDRAFLADPNLAPLHPAIRRRLATTLAFWSVALLHRADVGRARRLLRSSLGVALVPVSLPAATLAVLPAPFARRLATFATAVAAWTRTRRYATGGQTSS